MTRKDYEKIARVLAEAKPLQGTDYSDIARKVTWLHVVHGMADMLAEDNPRFDRDRFLKACGIDE